jgi:hypothetical protein
LVVAMKPNGPAIKGVCVTRRSHPANCPGTLAGKLSRWRGGYGTRFCSPVTRFIEHYAFRGTSLIANQLFIPVYNFGYMQRSGPDLSPYTVPVLRAGVKAKTVTNKLPLLSVLGFRCNYFSSMLEFVFYLFVSVCKESRFIVDPKTKKYECNLSIQSK